MTQNELKEKVKEVLDCPCDDCGVMENQLLSLFTEEATRIFKEAKPKERHEIIPIPLMLRPGQDDPLEVGFNRGVDQYESNLIQKLKEICEPS